uniref:Uncharacterized protein MANES_01G231800 n=1 Tax=Rhizophora mucronata TaxID=61149 RepID=A0A2P2J9E7_RHIMU
MLVLFYYMPYCGIVMTDDKMESFIFQLNVRVKELKRRKKDNCCILCCSCN